MSALVALVMLRKRPYPRATARDRPYYTRKSLSSRVVYSRGSPRGHPGKVHALERLFHPQYPCLSWCRGERGRGKLYHYYLTRLCCARLETVRAFRCAKTCTACTKSKQLVKCRVPSLPCYLPIPPNRISLTFQCRQRIKQALCCLTVGLPSAIFFCSASIAQASFSTVVNS